MKKAVIAALLFATTTLPAFAADIAAVRIHADWCPNCRALDPKVANVQADLDESLSVRFVRFDYTKKDKDKLWADAEAEGLKEALQAYTNGKIKTGLLLLVNEDTNEVVGKITSKYSEDKIESALIAAANS